MKLLKPVNSVDITSSTSGSSFEREVNLFGHDLLRFQCIFHNSLSLTTNYYYLIRFIFYKLIVQLRVYESLRFSALQLSFMVCVKICLPAIYFFFNNLQLRSITYFFFGDIADSIFLCKIPFYHRVPNG